MFYVCIDHLTDQQLALLGYIVIGEDATFKIYRCYDGDVHIVDKKEHPR